MDCKHHLNWHRARQFSSVGTQVFLSLCDCTQLNMQQPWDNHRKWTARISICLQPAETKLPCCTGNEGKVLHLTQCWDHSWAPGCPSRSFPWVCSRHFPAHVSTTHTEPQGGWALWAPMSAAHTPFPEEKPKAVGKSNSIKLFSHWRERRGYSR